MFILSQSTLLPYATHLIILNHRIYKFYEDISISKDLPTNEMLIFSEMEPV